MLNAIGTLCQKVKAIIDFIGDWECKEECALVGYVNVSQDGSINASCGDFTIEKQGGSGRYNVVAPPGAETADIQVVEPFNSRDAVSAHFASSFTEGLLWIGEHDNGGNPASFVDRPFSIRWYGKKMQVTCGK